jgi:hypothetical protein
MTFMNGEYDYDRGLHDGYGLVWPLDGPAPPKGDTYARGLYEGVQQREADQRAIRSPGGDVEAMQRLTAAGWFTTT